MGVTVVGVTFYLGFSWDIFFVLRFGVLGSEDGIFLEKFTRTPSFRM